MEDNDLMEMVAQRNPTPTTQLSETEQIRADALLARIRAQSRPAKATKPRLPLHRRGLKIAAVAGASLVGVTGIAWAADVNPDSIETGLHILQSADAGTVVYFDQPAEDGAIVLDRLITATASSGTLGEGDTSLLVTTSCADSWQDEDTQPESACVRDEVWALPDGNTRMKRVPAPHDSSAGWFEEWAQPTANELEDHPGFRSHGLTMTLGPTVSDTVSTLVPIVYENGEAQQNVTPDAWMIVEAYLGDYTTGLGVTANNRAAFLEALLHSDDTYYGPATDSLGRSGETFSVERKFSGHSEETRLVLDPTDGTILAVEKVLHGPWFIRGSQNHVESSVTYVEYGLVPTPAPCEETPGCEVTQMG